jgi:carbon storage regulator CsrA
MDKNLLVLRRRVGEVVSIAGGIEIEVMEISRTRVKLGVIAPRDVVVSRKEALATASENRKALELTGAVPQRVIDVLRLLHRQDEKV